MLQAKVNHDTQFCRIKGGVGVPPPPPPHLKELMKFYESCSQDDQVQLLKVQMKWFFLFPNLKEQQKSGRSPFTVS